MTSPSERGWGTFVRLHRWPWVVAVAGCCTVAAVLLGGRSAVLPGLGWTPATPLVALPALLLATVLGWALAPRAQGEDLAVRPVDRVGVALVVIVTVCSAAVVAATGPHSYVYDLFGSVGILLCTSRLPGGRRWGAAAAVSYFLVAAGLGGVLPGRTWWAFYLGTQTPHSRLLPCLLFGVGAAAAFGLPARER